LSSACVQRDWADLDLNRFLNQTVPNNTTKNCQLSSPYWLLQRTSRDD
jgi:hypothetical protein